MGIRPMANKELATQWKHSCMHGMYAWNDLDTPTVSTLGLLAINFSRRMGHDWTSGS